MSEKYIRQNKKSCTIVKSSKTYAKIADLDDAVFIRDFLIGNDWNLDKTPQILKKDDNYLVLTVYEDKIHVLAKYKKKPSSATVENLIKKHRRNPNNSRYGLNITRVFDVFIIKKQIAGDDYIFGYYDRLEDAEFVRNFLMDNSWNVNEFNQIEFDEDTDTYKVVKVIDDKVYVLDSFDTSEIDINKVLEEFLAKISKHRHGLAHYPHLDLLKDSIDDLENEFNVTARDENWNLNDIKKDPLSDIVFNMTPFQQSVYDAIDGETDIDEIKRKLIRYKSKNFEDKICKNLKSLIDMNLVEKQGDVYKKIK
jgi:hypothetical protein